MSRVARVLMLLVALALTIAACSQDTEEGAAEVEGSVQNRTDGADEPEDGASSSTAVNSGSEDTSSEVEASDGGETSGPIGELEAEWAEARAEVVQQIVDGGYGVNDDNELIGPGGFEIDLDSCPSDWSDDDGVDEAITIGHTTAQSGNLAAYGNVAVGFAAYLDYVNDNGGVDGRPVELVIKDDEYDAERTVELVDELLEIENPFYVTTLGFPSTIAVYDTLNELCVPQPFVMNGHPAWGDPLEHPWTTGLQMSYSTEAVLWGNWIKTNLAADLPVKVGGLVMDNEFGLAYRSSFERWADANPDVVSEFEAVPHEPRATDIADEMATVAEGEPDVFIAMTAGDPCRFAVQEAGSLGLTESAKALFAPSVCKDPVVYMAPAGTAGDGWYIVGGGAKSTTDPEYADDPFIEFINEELNDRGLDTTVGLFGAGFGTYAWAHVEALRIAAELPGGLSRSNFILAQRAMELTHPILLDGIAFAANGAEDGYFVEGSEYSQYDSAEESWTQLGSPVDLNGLSPTCSWSDNGC